jgi:hypothetical protein
LRKRVRVRSVVIPRKRATIVILDLIRNPWFDKLTMTTKQNWIPAFAGMTRRRAGMIFLGKL